MNAAQKYHLMFRKTPGLKHSYGKKISFLDIRVSLIHLSYTEFLTNKAFNRRDRTSVYFSITAQNKMAKMEACCDRQTRLYKGSLFLMAESSLTLLASLE